MRRTLRVVLLLILTGVMWNLPMPASAQKQPVRHVVVFKYKKGAPESQIAQVTQRVPRPAHADPGHHRVRGRRQQQPGGEEPRLHARLHADVRQRRLARRLPAAPRAQEVRRAARQARRPRGCLRCRLRRRDNSAAAIPAGRALLYGTLAVGVLDLLDAFVFFGLRSGVQPIRILQSIAAGLLGRASFTGGWPTAALGLVLHFFIAFVIVAGVHDGEPVAAVAAASRRHRRPALRRRRLSDDDVRRRSRISRRWRECRPWPVAINGVLIHMFGVGLPAALAARAARARGRLAAAPQVRSNRAPSISASEPAGPAELERDSTVYSSLIATLRISSFIGGPACSWKPISPAIDRPFTSSSTHTAVTWPLTM